MFKYLLYYLYLHIWIGNTEQEYDRERWKKVVLMPRKNPKYIYLHIMVYDDSFLYHFFFFFYSVIN